MIRSIIKGFISIFAVIAVLFCAYLAFAWWDIRQLNAFCNEIHEGTSYSSLPSLAEKYGFERRWVERGIKDQNSENWIMFVPASSSMGEVVCAIRYNKTSVISAKIDP